MDEFGFGLQRWIYFFRVAYLISGLMVYSQDKGFYV